MRSLKSARWIGLALIIFFAGRTQVTGAPNDPVADDQIVTTAFRTPKAITLTGSDPNSLPLTYAITKNPTHGVLSFTPALPNVTYTPNTSTTGEDSFTFRVDDGPRNSKVATVSITVNSPVAPTANPQTVTTAFNTAKAVTLTGTDPLGLPLTYLIVTNPAHGTLTGTGPNRTYTPAAAYTGSDSFTFKVNNGLVDSTIATVSLTVGVPGVPIANSQSASTAFNVSRSITLTGSDPSGLPLTYNIAGNPAHGALSGTSPNVSYNPTLGYAGPDSFSFEVNNGFQNSAPATVTITVNSPAPPTAGPQTVGTSFNTAQVVTLTGTDPNNLPLTYLIVTNPAHGTLTGGGTNRSYTPATNYTGVDSFTFKVNNGFADSNAATINITVNPPGAPTAISQSVSTAFNVSLAITLSGSDPNSLPLTYSIEGNPAHGTLSGIAPNVTFTPASGYAGADSFAFKVTNGSQDSNTATVSIVVQAAAAVGPTSLQPPVINVSGPVSLNDVITITPAPCCFADLYVWNFIPLNTPSNTGSASGVISVPQASTQLSLADLGLHVGTYQLRVHAESGSVRSVDAVINLAIVSSTLSGMRVYPNPWRSDQDSDVDVTFDHLSPGATIKIFDMAAHWVRTLNATSDAISWDRRNDSGDVVASGMYLYLVTDNQGSQTRGKLTVIK